MAKKSAKKRVNYTYVAVVLDCSGSMEAIQLETAQAFNNQIETIKKMATDSMVVITTLVFFNDMARVAKAPCDVSEIKGLSAGEYVPNGMTAMYDGVALAINLLEEVAAERKPEDDVAFLVSTISDGMENASRKITGVALAEKIQSLQTKGNWTFTYLGANQDLSKISATLNIPIGNTNAFAVTHEGFASATNMHSHSLSNYMGMRGATGPSGMSGQSCVNFYDNEKPEDEKDGK